MTEKALASVIEAYILGISTRSMDDLVAALGMTGNLQSQVFRLCQDIDVCAKAAPQGRLALPLIDVAYVKVRVQGCVVSVAVIVPVGVDTDGRREVLGMDTGLSEAGPFWTAFLRKLSRSGLRDIKLVIRSRSYRHADLVGDGGSRTAPPLNDERQAAK